MSARWKPRVEKREGWSFGFGVWMFSYQTFESYRRAVEVSFGRRALVWDWEVRS